MRYIANPVEVEARRIIAVTQSPSDGVLRLTLEDDSDFIPDGPMLARMKPYPGDYVVTQSDGYIYLNPQEVFERKYRPMPEGIIEKSPA